MVVRTYMLDTCICSFIMRKQPVSILERLNNTIKSNHRIVISAITYAEMRFGSIGKKASPKHAILVDAFTQRVDEIMAWDMKAVDATTHIKEVLSTKGTPIGNNDTAIAGHAIATQAILVTHNVREFKRVDDLVLEDWYSADD